MIVVRAVLSAILLVVLLAGPALAHEDDGHGRGREKREKRALAVAAEDDGVEPVQFVALLVAGVAIMTAVTALVAGPRRLPS